MADSFAVNVAEVRQHAQTVATISNQVSSAVNMAASSVGGDSYGVVGKFFASALIMASELVRDGLLGAAKSFVDVHNGLRDVADLYQQVDQAHAQLLAVTGGEERR
ncbi:MAG TPA: type VII secretion target [Actinophytocola sp.]|uniref:type VII secretion target n=1 Tax=Actinophytocola sp. TaxID=1872138 RepID=UPI002DBB814D|nr:type VII secretion target [Actinophytocola sp.]HEU5475422.1 type VII secretion target [Actinophytocola sp.]